MDDLDDDVVETSDAEELEELRAPLATFSYVPFERHNFAYTSPRDDGPSPRKRIKLCHPAFAFANRQSGSQSPADLTVTSQKLGSSVQMHVDDATDATSTLCMREAHNPSSQCSHDPLLLKTPPTSRSLASTPTNNDQLIAFSEHPNLPPESYFVTRSDMDSLFTPPSSNIKDSPAKRNHTVIPLSPASPHSIPSSPLTVLWSPHESNNQRAPSPLSATHLDKHCPEPSLSGTEQISMQEMPGDDSRNVSRYPLRPRQPVQLHPYFIDKVHYKQALRGNPDAMVLVRSPERNRRVQEYEETQIETQETEYTPVSKGDRSRSRSPSQTRSQNVLRPTESEPSPVRYPEILQDLPSSDSEEKEARREVSREIRKTQKGQIRGRMQHLRNPKSFPLLLAGAVGSKKRRDSSGSDAFHAPQMSPRFRRPVVDADGEGGDSILPAVAPSGSSSPTTIFQNDVLSPLNAEWRNQDLNLMADVSGELGGLDDFDASQSSDHDFPTSRESTPGSKKVILDKKKLKALGRMLPKSMINGLMHRRALPERAPQNRQRSPTVISEEDSEGPLLPGQTRVRKNVHIRLVQDVRGDPDSSEGRSTECETTSSFVEIMSSKWTRDVITISDTENDSGNGLNGSSDEDIGDDDIQAYMDDDAPSDAREVNLIDNMLSRTWTVGNGTKPRSTTRERRPRKKEYALDIVTSGTHKHSKGRQSRLNFDNHTSGPRRSGFRPAPARNDKTSDAFQHMAKAAKRQRKWKTNRRHKMNGLYVFSGEGKRRIISGRSEVQPVSVDMYVDTREAYNEWADAFQPPSSSLRDRAIIHQADRTINALTKNRRRNVAIDSDEEKLFSADDDDDPIASTPKTPSNMGVHLLPPGITFGDQTYIGKHRLDQLISISLPTIRIPEPAPCDLRGYSLRSDMTLDDFSGTLHRICQDIVEFSTGLPEVDQAEKLREWDIVSRAVFQLLSWFRASSDDEQLQRMVERNASAIVDHIRELDLTSKSLDSAILQVDWFAVELLARAGCKVSLSGSDTGTSNVFHKTLSLLVDHLVELDVFFSVEAVMQDNPLTNLSLAQESAELWVCLIHLLGAYSAQAMLRGVKPLWSLVLTSLQKRDGKQSNLKASEKVWETIFCLNALSQFSVYGMTTSQPRLPAAWPLVVYALKKIRLAVNVTTDKNLSAATLIQRDKYIGVIALRCFQLCDKWNWQLDDASEVFNELGEIFRSRKFANLRHEKPDYPLFMLRNDWSLLSQGAKRDSAFTLFLKLIVKAGKSESSSELSPKFKKFLSLAIPVGSLPFTKATPPSKEDLSMLFNRFSAVAIGIYLDRQSYKTRVSHARTYVAFASADTTTRMAVIRGMMNLANLIRTIELPLGVMAEWISDISLALAEELKSMPTLPNEPKINRINQEQQPQSVEWCHLHICIQMLLSSIRRILGSQNENREYPETALISSLKPLYMNARISHEPKTMHEIQRLTTVLLNSRSNALPLPERPLIVSEANSESQEEYNAAFAAFDFEDPNLIAALVDGGVAGLPTHKANEEKLYSVINETNLFWLCWRNLTKLIQDINEKALTIRCLNLLDNRIYSWLGCADVLVRNGSGKTWTMILGQREVWKITNEVLRRRVDLGVAMQLLKLHPMMYTTHIDMFLEVFLESFAAEKHTIEHEYASLLLSIDGLRHPLLQGLTCIERQGHEDYNVSEHEYSALKSVILQTIFRNLNGLLEYEAESSAADLALGNEKFMGYCIKYFSAMRSVSSGLVKESQAYKSYIEWCKQVFRSVQELEHFRSHPRLTYWISWARALEVNY